MHIYAREVLTLAQQHGGLSAEEILDRLYHNMIPDYLIRGVEEWELHTKAAQDRKASAEAAANTKARSVTYYDTNECCGRCGRRGHHRWNCRIEERIRYEAYGREDIPTKYCHPRCPGNGGRVALPRPSGRSAETKTTDHTSGRRSGGNDSRPSSTPASTAP
jgi:hypothetical protein